MGEEKNHRSLGEYTNDGNSIEQKTTDLELTHGVSTFWGEVFGYSLMVIFFIFVVLSFCVLLALIMRHPFSTIGMLLLSGFIFFLCDQRERTENKETERPEKHQEQVLSSAIFPCGDEPS